MATQRARIDAVAVLAGVATSVVALVQLFLPSPVGLADNGDYTRLVCHVGIAQAHAPGDFRDRARWPAAHHRHRRDHLRRRALGEGSYEVGRHLFLTDASSALLVVLLVAALGGRFTRPVEVGRAAQSIEGAPA